MFGSVVLEIPKHAFEEVFDAKKKQKKAKLDTDLDAKALQGSHRGVQEGRQEAHQAATFPQDPHEQLVMARDAVFRSWQNDRAKHYRRINNIDDMLGTAVNVQAMVFGNLGDTSGTGVGFTRNPATGAKEFYGEFLMNAQGEDVVAGIRTPVPILELQKVMPEVYDQLARNHHASGKALPRHAGFRVHHPGRQALHAADPQRQAHRPAAVRVAIQMVDEGLITKEEAIFRVEPNQLYDFLVPRLDEKSAKIEVLATGLPASPGAAVGQIVFTADEAVEKARHGASKHPVILVRARNHSGRHSRHGSRGRNSDFARRHDQPRRRRHARHGQVLRGRRGRYRSRRKGARDAGERARSSRAETGFRSTAPPAASSRASSSTMAAQARRSGTDEAHELGRTVPQAGCARQCRHSARCHPGARFRRRRHRPLPHRAHVLRAKTNLPHMRAMILANNEKDRRAALKKLLPMQRADFVGVFRAMDGFPVTIRTLDPPLHEFLPRREDLMVEIA